MNKNIKIKGFTSGFTVTLGKRELILYSVNDVEMNAWVNCLKMLLTTQTGENNHVNRELEVVQEVEQEEVKIEQL